MTLKKFVCILLLVPVLLFAGVVINGARIFPNITTPSAPSSGFVALYAKGSAICSETSGAVETCGLGGGSGATGPTGPTGPTGGGGGVASIIGTANWTIAGGSITSPTYHGVVSSVTRTGTGQYTVALSGVTGTNYNVLCMPVTTASNYTICNVLLASVAAGGFTYQTVNQAGNTFEDATPSGFIIVQ